ncbi:Bromodomain-containing protein [Diaporthe sp. PMI_573]|nr:Bromodomain-containing protein [Diaporthaceae sp. PMI_573]
MAINPEGFPKCHVCFKNGRTCNGDRPCSRCIALNGKCRDVDQDILDEFPDRAQRVFDNYKLKELTRRKIKRNKRAALAASDDEQNAAKKPKTASVVAADASQYSLEHCSQVINELLSDKYASCSSNFLEPADYVELSPQDYLIFTKDPMDLRTMKTKIDNGKYKTSTDFVKDFLKVLKAARVLHKRMTEVCKAADKLDKVFRTLWDGTEESGEETEESGRETEESGKKTSGEQVDMEGDDQHEQEEQAPSEI